MSVLKSFIHQLNMYIPKKRSENDFLHSKNQENVHLTEELNQFPVLKNFLKNTYGNIRTETKKSEHGVTDKSEFFDNDEPEYLKRATMSQDINQDGLLSQAF